MLPMEGMPMLTLLPCVWAVALAVINWSLSNSNVVVFDRLCDTLGMRLARTMDVDVANVRQANTAQQWHLVKRAQR